MNISAISGVKHIYFEGMTSKTLFLYGCNFRCPFCRNSTLVDPNSPLKEDKFIDVNRVIESLKLDYESGIIKAVAIYGGEPLMQPDLPELCKRIKDIGLRIKLGTNGTNAKLLKQIIDEGNVELISMDIKAGKSNYDKASGIHITDTIWNNIVDCKNMLLDLRKGYEFNTTTVKGLHIDEDFYYIREFIPDARRYNIQQYRESEFNLHPEGLSPFNTDELKHFLSIVLPKIPNAQLKNVGSSST